MATFIEDTEIKSTSQSKKPRASFVDTEPIAQPKGPELKASESGRVNEMISSAIRLGPLSLLTKSKGERQLALDKQNQVLKNIGKAGLDTLAFVGTQLDTLPTGAPARALMRGPGMSVAIQGMKD